MVAARAALSPEQHDAMLLDLRELTVRLNAMGHGSDVAGRDQVFNNRWGVALAANYRATDKLTLSADYFHLTTDEMPDWGVPYDLPSNRPFHHQVPRTSRARPRQAR